MQIYKRKNERNSKDCVRNDFEMRIQHAQKREKDSTEAAESGEKAEHQNFLGPV